MPTFMPFPLPRTDNQTRGFDAASRAIKQANAPWTAEGASIGAGEVNHVFGVADRYLEDHESQSFENKAKLAIQMLSKNPTKPAVQAILKHLDMDNPVDPPVDPDPGPGPIIVRPRYGLMETSRPIVDRLNADGPSSPEDIAKARVLAKLAELGEGGSEPAVRGRAFGTRALRGVRSTDAAATSEVRRTLEAAIRNATGE